MKFKCLVVLGALAVFAFTPLAAEGADVITLTTGETLQGKLVEQNAETMTLYHPILGRLTIRAEQVTAIQKESAQTATIPPTTPAPPPTTSATPTASTPSEAPAATTSAPAAPTVSAIGAQVEEKPKPEKWTLFDDWESSLELGFNGSEGNTETFNVYFGFDSINETPTDVWKADASYFLNSNDGETSKNEFDSGLRREWLKVDSPWFVFAQGRFDFDEFAQYDYRLTSNAGLGYDLITQDAFVLKVLGGLGGAKEFSSPNDELRPEALAGFELEWAIKKGHKFTADTFFYPDLSETQRFRIESNAAWVIKLDDALGTSLKLGLKNEYESHTSDDTKLNDLKYFGAVILDF